LIWLVLFLMVVTAALVLLDFTRPTSGAEPAKKSQSAKPQPRYKSPLDVRFSPDGMRAYVTNHTADTISVIDAPAKKVIKEIAVGREPTELCVSPDGKWVYVTCTRDQCVAFVNLATGKVEARVKAGLEPTGICITRDGKTIYIANFISNDISAIDVASRKEKARIRVGRNPRYLALTPDDKKLVVSNFLSGMPATNPKSSSYLSVVDTAACKEVAQKRSPGTMLMLRHVAVSPDGKWAFVVHHRPNFNVTPSQLSQGWIQTNALTIASLEPNGPVYTVLLDNVNSGAANPFGVALSKDGQRLFVTHYGMDFVSVIDLPRLRDLIAKSPEDVRKMMHVNLAFLWGKNNLIKRVPSGGIGPRGIAASPRGCCLFIANYFSDNIAVMDPKTCKITATIPVGPPQEITQVRLGEMLFYSGKKCFQNWLSCTSCHPDVRADGVNWDLLNDGMTNPKNAKSLVGSWKTPPAMVSGVRPSMEVAVEKGFFFIQFYTASKDELEAVQAFLRSVKWIPSPYLNPDGSLSESAKRGEKVFKKAGCDVCHPPPLFTDLQMHDVGTKGSRDPRKEFDTPTLKEMYRTGPFLHDGRAVTLKEVLKKFNPKDEHGVTSNLSDAEIDDLVAYILSL